MFVRCKKTLCTSQANQTLLCERDSLTQWWTMPWRMPLCTEHGQPPGTCLEDLADEFNMRLTESKEDHEEEGADSAQQEHVKIPQMQYSATRSLRCHLGRFSFSQLHGS